MAEKYCCNFLMNFLFLLLFYFLGREEKLKTREDKRMIKLDFFNDYKIAFCAYIKKNNKHVHFLLHGRSSWSTFDLHLPRGAKDFGN